MSDFEYRPDEHPEDGWNMNTSDENKDVYTVDNNVDIYEPDSGQNDDQNNDPYNNQYNDQNSDVYNNQYNDQYNDSNNEQVNGRYHYGREHFQKNTDERPPRWHAQGQDTDTDERMYRYDNGRGTAEKKKRGGARGILKLVGSALIFGVVAGAAFTGVTMVKNHFTSSSKSTERIETTVAADGSDSTSSGSTTVSAQDVSSIVSKVMPSVVSITGTFQTSSYFGLGTQESQGAGSGFLIADDDDKIMIATNNHVVEDATSLTVGFCDDSTAEATIVGTDSDADLAVISVKKDDVSKDTLSTIKVATLGSSDDMKVGEAVIAIGNALGYGQSVTTGVVSAKDREVSFTDGTMVLLQTDAAINPGNSGGVLVNLKGQVIGINNAKLEDTSVEGMGYAIPISTASTLLDDLMNAGSISEKDAAFLGIVGKTIDSTYSEALGMPSGIYVSQVVDDSPAEKAGISAGDVITEFEGNKISTMTGLQEKIALKKAGTTVKITIQRANQNGEYEEQTIEATLGKQSDYSDVVTKSSDSDSSDSQDSQNSQSGNSDNSSSSNPYEYYYGDGNSNGGSYNPYYYFFNN